MFLSWSGLTLTIIAFGILDSLIGYMYGFAMWSWTSLMQSLLNGDRSLDKAHNTSLQISMTQLSIYLKLESFEVTLSKVSSKLLYNAFKSKKQVPPHCSKEVSGEFSPTSN